MMNIKSYCAECRGDYSVDNNNENETENGGEKVGRKLYYDHKNGGGKCTC